MTSNGRALAQLQVVALRVERDAPDVPLYGDCATVVMDALTLATDLLGLIRAGRIIVLDESTTRERK